MCPNCGRDAPIVYRGVMPYCTACGAPRAPLSGASVNLAGKPSKLGGAVASVIGWLWLVMGGSLALGIILLFAAFHALAFGLAFGLPIAIVAVALGTVLVRRGSSLSRSGQDAERLTREQALLELAAHRGRVTAADVASVLGVSVAGADAMLTDLAKHEPDRVAVDVDDQGVVWFRVTTLAGTAMDPRVRVGGAEENEAAAETEAEEAKRGAARVR